jgi:hypothetical protein
LKKKLLFLIMSFFLIAFRSFAGQVYEVSLGKIDFNDGDCIKSFKLSFIGASINSVNKLPVDGRVSVDNWKSELLPRWSGEVEWGSTVGAGYLSPEYFHNFLSLDIPDDKKFDIELELMISNLRPSAKVGFREVKVTRKNLVLTPMPEK